MLAFLLLGGTLLGLQGLIKTPLVQSNQKDKPMKLGILIGVIVAALLVGFAFVKDEAPASGSVKDNFGNNWAR